MSNDTRTMVAVLVVCGLLVCGCILLPVGLGAALLFMAGERVELAQAQARQALALEREAAARAQADAQAAQNALQAALPTPPTSGPQTSAPPGSLPDLPGPPESPRPTTTPDISLPPLGGLGGAALPEEAREALSAALADVEKRKELYRAFKQLRELEKLGAEPTGLASAKQLFSAWGLTQEQIDKILAEGDKEGW